MKFKQVSFDDLGENDISMRYRYIYSHDEEYSVPEILNTLDKEKIREIEYIDCNDYRQIDDGFYTNVDDFFQNYERIRKITKSECMYVVHTCLNDKPVDIDLLEHSTLIRIETDDPSFDIEGIFVE